MKKLIPILMLAIVAFTSPAAWATLAEVTSLTYAWEAYNAANISNQGSRDTSISIPANTTKFTFDQDGTGGVYWDTNAPTPPRGTMTTGLMLKLSDGSSTGVTATVSNKEPETTNTDVAYNFIETSLGAINSDSIFDDVYGTSINGAYVKGNQNGNNGAAIQTVTFSGLNLLKTYTFAGVTGTNSTNRDTLVTVSANDNTTFTTDVLLQDINDRALFTGLIPNADGTLRFTQTINSPDGAGGQQMAGFAAFALGEEAAEPPPVPEPSSVALGVVGLIGLGFAVYRKRRRA